MEEKLEEYRLRKRRAKKIEEIKSKIRNMFTVGSSATDSKEESRESHVVNIHEKSKDEPKSLPAVIEHEDSDLPTISENDLVLSTTDEERDLVESDPIKLDSDSKTFKYTLCVVALLFWVTLYIIAIELGFGIVFLMFSSLFGIYFNTRTGPRKRHEVSAYSVFNKNCHSIDGTLKAEQFEQELRYGPGAVR